MELNVLIRRGHFDEKFDEIHVFAQSRFVNYRVLDVTRAHVQRGSNLGCFHHEQEAFESRARKVSIQLISHT